MLIDDAKSFNGRGLAACYVDFCKAFDSISRWAVQAMLLSWHVPQQNVAEIMRMLRKLVQHRGIQNPQDKHDVLQLRCLAFADDIVLLASSVADLHSLLVTLESAALVVGLGEWFTEGISSCSKLVTQVPWSICDGIN